MESAIVRHAAEKGFAMESIDLQQVFTGPARTEVPGATTAQDKPSGQEDQGWRDEN